MKKLNNDRGIALVAIIMMIMVLLAITGAGLIASGLNLKIASNLKLGNAALQAADAGVQQAVASIGWGTAFGYTSSTSIVPSTTLNGYTYTVAAFNDSTSTGGNTRAQLTSTATGPNGVKKVIVAYVKRSAVGGGGPGAIYLPGPGARIETSFAGNSFLISGNDTNSDGTAGPKPPAWGIATTSADTKTEITNDTTSDGGLSSQQMDNVTGYGGSPSVGVISAFPQTVSQIADAILTSTHTDVTGSSFNGNTVWGTDAAPRITRVIPDTDNHGNPNTITINGNLTGSGVLIIDGAVDILGHVNFHGLIIARGPVNIEITGDAHVYGSVWVAEQNGGDAGTELDVRGNANIYYSSQGMNYAYNLSPGSFPQPPVIVAWKESM